MAASENAIRLGAAVCALQEATGMSQQAVADALGCSQSTIGRIENGRLEPSLDRLFALAAFFSVGVENLLHGRVAASPPKVYLATTVLCDACGEIGSGLSASKARQVRVDHVREHLTERSSD